MKGVSLLSENKEIIGKVITHVDFSTSDLTGSTFEDCVFDHCVFKNCDLTDSRIIDCKFISCDLSNAKFQRATLRSATFENCKLMGIHWTQFKSFGNAGFNNCNLIYCSFVGLKLKKIMFDSCNLRDTDFSLADLSEGNFSNSDLLGAQFHETLLLKTDFRGAINYAIDPTSNKVKGARFSLPEAVGLLVGLGVVID